ncbi:metallophosphoesterase [Halalkalibacter akibai]|uniref:Phosphoesterase n=1 Tax=Halalkalibacter akibai (strain ATCC 43226 / DSM 21942 / CIP 109018 / JCM 9157 / 1139) TaxID=1236973 RepID=W4QUX0_HALA3|nr:metallophosphoesterase [Halalkalibacter akibai]GAE35896.1 phosphoesterase [Halalkalibacter akibai JCM 9157]
MFLIVIGVMFGILLSYMFLEGNRNRIRKTTLSYETLPKSFDGFRLFFISDVHRRRISDKIIQNLHGVDCIVIGGDLCERGVSLNRIEENIKQLTSKAPCYFVWGNNDPEVGKHHLKSIFNKFGVVELENDQELLKRNKEFISIVGINEIDTAMRSISKFNLPPDQFSILVCHYPEIAELPIPEFPLLLTGHTHGGQIRIFGYGIARKGGLYKQNGSDLLISNGYGTTALPLRLGAPAETHILTLMCED